MIAGVKPPLPVNPVDLNEAGRVLATLNDWRALMFAQLIVMGVLVLVILFLVIVIVRMANRRSANDQATLQVVKEATAALTDHAASLRAVEVVVARLESERAA